MPVSPEVLAELRSLNDKLDKMIVTQSDLQARMAATESTLVEWRINIARFWEQDWNKFDSLTTEISTLEKELAILRERQPKVVAGAVVGGGAGFLAMLLEGVRMFLSGTGKG